MNEIASIVGVVLLFGGIFIGYWLRGFSVDDLEVENLTLRDVNNKLSEELRNANLREGHKEESMAYWRTRYGDLVEAVKKKAAEKPIPKILQGAICATGQPSKTKPTKKK